MTKRWDFDPWVVALRDALDGVSREDAGYLRDAPMHGMQTHRLAVIQVKAGFALELVHDLLDRRADAAANGRGPRVIGVHDPGWSWAEWSEDLVGLASALVDGDLSPEHAREQAREILDGIEETERRRQGDPDPAPGSVTPIANGSKTGQTASRQHPSAGGRGDRIPGTARRNTAGQASFHGRDSSGPGTGGDDWTTVEARLDGRDPFPIQIRRQDLDRLAEFWGKRPPGPAGLGEVVTRRAILAYRRAQVRRIRRRRNRQQARGVIRESLADVRSPLRRWRIRRRLVESFGALDRLNDERALDDQIIALQADLARSSAFTRAQRRRFQRGEL